MPAMAPGRVEVLPLLGHSPQVQVRDDEPLLPHDRRATHVPSDAATPEPTRQSSVNARLPELSMQGSRPARPTGRLAR